MFQTADFGNLDDRTELRPLDWPALGGILGEREERSRAVIIHEVTGENAAEVLFAEDKDMIETLAPHGADEPFHEGVLPRTLGCCDHLTDPHALHPVLERAAVDLVTIAEEIGGRGIVGEGVDDLLGRPCGGRMLGHVEVDNAPPRVGEHDQDEEHAQLNGRNGEEVDREVE